MFGNQQAFSLIILKIELKNFENKHTLINACGLKPAISTIFSGEFIEYY